MEAPSCLFSAQTLSAWNALAASPLGMSLLFSPGVREAGLTFGVSSWLSKGSSSLYWYRAITYLESQVKSLMASGRVGRRKLLLDARKGGSAPQPRRKPPLGLPAIRGRRFCWPPGCTKGLFELWVPCWSHGSDCRKVWMEANITLTSGIHREAEGRSAWGCSDCKETVNKPRSVQRPAGLRWKQRFYLALTHVTVWALLR